MNEDGEAYGSSDKWAKVFASMSGAEGKRWARPEEPLLHDMNDEKAEPQTFFHNNNYRISRKYINQQKVKILQEEVLFCTRSSGHAKQNKCAEIFKRFHAAVRVASNVDRGPLARKRDVNFIYTAHKLKTLAEEAAELGVENPYRPPAPASFGFGK
ncbi:MAG: hypothetical protein WDW36_005653 [Sanguina aurantia]